MRRSRLKPPCGNLAMTGKSLLLHCCCAHCTAYTFGYWRQQGYSVSAFWYNPNIHPYAEHQIRLEAIKYLAKEIGMPLIMAGDYDMTDYFKQVAGHESERCRYCFKLRLKKTAETALENGFGAFTTSLLISPHQEHDRLREVGQSLNQELGLDFLYSDLRKRYSDSRRLTRGLNLYRQQYCGCLYSERERHAAIKRAD